MHICDFVTLLCIRNATRMFNTATRTRMQDHSLVLITSKTVRYTCIVNLAYIIHHAVYIRNTMPAAATIASSDIMCMPKTLVTSSSVTAHASAQLTKCVSWSPGATIIIQYAAVFVYIKLVLVHFKFS